MENVRKRVDVRLVTSKEKLLKLSSKPIFVRSKICNENLVSVHKIKETLTLNKPAYVEMCIFDLSKTLMYDFHYNYIRKNYGEKARQAMYIRTSIRAERCSTTVTTQSLHRSTSTRIRKSSGR